LNKVLCFVKHTFLVHACINLNAFIWNLNFVRFKWFVFFSIGVTK